MSKVSVERLVGGSGLSPEKIWEGDISTTTINENSSTNLTNDAITATDIAGYDALILCCEGTLTSNLGDTYFRLGGPADKYTFDGSMSKGNQSVDIKLCRLCLAASADGTSWVMLSRNVQTSSSGRSAVALRFDVNQDIKSGSLHVKVLGIKF